MHNWSRFGSVLGAAAALGLFAGCSGNGATPRGGDLLGAQSTGAQASGASAERRTLQRYPSVLLPERQGPIHAGTSVKGFISPRLRTPSGVSLFLSDYFNNVVYIYSGGGVLTGTLTGFAGPQGLTTDAAANLYVADTYNSRVQIYAAGYNSAPTTLTDTGQYPTDVAVDGNGNVAVMNVYTIGGGSGSVSLYAAGATSPTNTISSTAFGEVLFGAFDAAGNLYVDGLDLSGHALVGEIVGGISGTTITALTAPNAAVYPGGIQVTPQGLIAVDDQRSRAIFAYNPPVNGTLGAPLGAVQLGNAGDPVTFVLAPTSAYALTADFGNHAVSAYRVPAGGSPIDTLQLPQGDGPTGIAITPTTSF